MYIRKKKNSEKYPFCVLNNLSKNRCSLVMRFYCLFIKKRKEKNPYLANSCGKENDEKNKKNVSNNSISFPFFIHRHRGPSTSVY